MVNLLDKLEFVNNIFLNIKKHTKNNIVKKIILCYNYIVMKNGNIRKKIIKVISIILAIICLIIGYIFIKYKISLPMANVPSTLM